MKYSIAFTLVAVVLSPLGFAGKSLKWGSSLLDRKADWYASEEARSAADNVALYQSEFGGWPKNTNLLAPATAKTIAKVGRKANTIDNGGTTLPMRFIAMVNHASPDSKYKNAFVRGVNYLLASQYANGGFPQFFPLRDGYYSHVTFNDNAMTNALEMLRDTAKGNAPYDCVDADLRARAAESVERGIECILRTQIRQDGELTAWCAQYDENTLEPAWARSYEPPSISGSESVRVVGFLMSIEDPTPEIVAAIESAVAWFRGVVITGVRLERIQRVDGRSERVLVNDFSAPPLWARFYELETNRPLYVDRDSVFRYDFSEISYERRSGYSYLGAWPARLLDRDYERWHARLASSANASANANAYR